VSLWTYVCSVKRPPQFDAWIDLYASDEFEKEVTDFIKIIDNVAKNLDEASISRMEEHFVMCCKLEHMFWDQAEELTKWPSNLE
jgi:thiaminase/transcriptional activator TenA